MAEEITVRAAEAEDAAALTALSNMAGFRFGTGRLPFATVAATRTWLEGLGRDAMEVVAESGGGIVGAAGLQRHAARRSHAALVHIGVHDGWVGRGVGTALLVALVDAADRWLALRRLELTVYTDNPAGLALYRRFGFEIEGTLRAFAFRDGRYVDAFTMARLAPGAGWGGA